jgi:ankyrin repeat protein
MKNSDHLLMKFFGATVAGQLAHAQQLLVDEPKLASASLERGATRQTPQEFYFEAIGHYVYAGDTALHVAAAAYSLALTRRLIKLHGNVSASNRRGAQPLHYAADGAPGSGHWNPLVQAKVIRALVEAGADPNAVDKNGVSPLHRAIRTRCSSAVESLIDCGADVVQCNGSGSTPLDLASKMTGRGGSGSPLAKKEQARILTLLERRAR